MTRTAPTGRDSPSLPVRGALAVVLSVLVNVALVIVVGWLAVAPDFRALTVPPVAFLSAIGAIGATVAYWLLDRYVTDTDRTFLRVAAVALLLSFVPDVALLAADPAATPLGVVVLMAMHVVVAAAAVWVLVSWRRR